MKKICNVVDSRRLYFNAKEVSNKRNYLHISVSQFRASYCHQHTVVCTAQACSCDQAVVKHSLSPDDGRECTPRSVADNIKLRGSSQYAGGQGYHSEQPGQTGEVG